MANVKFDFWHLVVGHRNLLAKSFAYVAASAVFIAGYIGLVQFGAIDFIFAQQQIANVTT